MAEKRSYYRHLASPDAVRPGDAPRGVCLMTFQSILFEKTEDGLKKETLEAPIFFGDLNLD